MKPLIISIFLTYLRLAAKIQLWKIRPQHVIGITGSAGKSSCREAIYAILKDRYHVKQSSTGNSETGIPLDILGFTDEHKYSLSYWLRILIVTPLMLIFNWNRYDIYIAEMGVDSPNEPKNMGYLLKIIRPDIGVFLNVLPVHTEYFSKIISYTSGRLEMIGECLEKIAAEKGKLISSLPVNGFAILNADDNLVIPFKDKTKAKVISFGKRGEVKPLLVDIPGYLLTDDYGYTLAAAAAVGQTLNISQATSYRLLTTNYQLPPGRMSVLPGINNSTIIDSSYNSSPVPTVSALKLLLSQKSIILDKYYTFLIRRRIAVLGDMRELGKLAEDAHKKVATEALKDADLIFTFGPLTEKYFPNNSKVQKFRKMKELIRGVKAFIKPGDVVLIKGSQNTILLETLVEQLLVSPEDIVKLCRRGEYWERKRQELMRI